MLNWIKRLIAMSRRIYVYYNHGNFVNFNGFYLLLQVLLYTLFFSCITKDNYSALMFYAFIDSVGKYRLDNIGVFLLLLRLEWSDSQTIFIIIYFTIRSTVRTEPIVQNWLVHRHKICVGKGFRLLYLATMSNFRGHEMDQPFNNIESICYFFVLCSNW